MRNKAPIFVNGLSRGGTTILMNLLASHPHVGTVGEVHQVFKGSNVLDSPWHIVHKTLCCELPILLASRQDVFSPRNRMPRRRLGAVSQALIDRALFAAKLRRRDARLNRFKQPDVRYTRAELNATRLLGKNLDGMVLMTDNLAAMYPDASFVGLLRHGLAVCEGRVRRGMRPHNAARLYRQVTEKMLCDAESMPNYHLIRFEDLLEDPLKCLQELLVKLNLNPFLLRYVRMQRRKTINDQGRHCVRQGREWDVVWYEKSALAEHLDRDIDRRQIGLLPRAAATQFMHATSDLMQRLNYGPGASVTPGASARAAA